MFRPKINEGVGNAGCSMHPQPRVGKNRTTRASSPQVHRFRPAFPHAMVLTVYPVIFPVIGLCCHRRQQSCLRRLDASVEASEPHDFAVRPSAVRQQHVGVHRIPPRVRDDRDRPSMGRDGGAYGFDLGQSRTDLFLQWEWTGQIRLIRLNKSAFCENCPGAILVRLTL
jgi:hypothetical protein